MNFDINPFNLSNCFRNFCNRSQLKQPFSSNFSISNCNQLKIGHKFEPQFELELKSNLNSSSSYCFCSRSARARRWPLLKNNKRRRLWEPSDTRIVNQFQAGCQLFLKRFSAGFFSQKWCQMEPKMASKRSRNLIKNELETKSTKNAENVLNLIPMDLQETRFRMEWLSKITKTRGTDK